MLLVESDNLELNRSLMVTTEIAGSSIASVEPSQINRRILGEAGADLASVNRVQVEGFGWIRRDRRAENALRGEFSTYSEWIDNHYRECPSVLAAAGVLTKSEADALDHLIAREAGSASSDQAYLVGTQRRAMCLRGVLEVRRAVADVSAGDDQ